MSGDSDFKRSEIHVDDDWKRRVKAEDAALDQQFQSETAPQEPAAKPAEPQKAEPQKTKPAETETGKAAESRPLDPRMFPPADFQTLVGMFSTQAMLSLGLFPNPATGETEVQPELARHFIDLLGVLEEKTKGNLSPGEHSLLETTLHQLRMAYVELTRQPAVSTDQAGTECPSA